MTTGHSSQGLATTTRRHRARVVMDSNFRPSDMRVLRAYAAKHHRSVASLLREIVDEWMRAQRYAGEFKELE